MTQEDIIRMARAAGGADITCSGWTSWVGTQSTEFLERFAALVRADEREACATECERMMMYPNARQESAAHQDVWAAAKAIRARGQA